MPTIRQLEYFVAVSETKHFHKAAHSLGVAQPTLSAQIKALEESLGVRLFERSRTSVILTDVGRDILQLSNDVLRNVQEIRDTALIRSKAFSGTVKLGVSPTIGAYLLPHVLPALHKAHKNLKLYVREVIPALMPSELNSGKHDLLLTTTPIKSTEFHSISLFREPLYIAVPAEWPLAKQDKIERKDLKGQSLLALEKGHQLHEQVEAICEEFGAKLLFDYEGTSLDTIRQMVGMGMGLSILPGLYVKSELRKDKTVVVRELKSRNLYRTVGYVWRKNAIRSKEFDEVSAYTQAAVKSKFSDFSLL